MYTKCLKTIVMITFLSFIYSCSGTFHKETKLERNWGKSFRDAKTNQILNPDADKNLEPVIGMDGQTAENKINNYRSKWSGKKKEDSVNIIKLQ